MKSKFTTLFILLLLSVSLKAQHKIDSNNKAQEKVTFIVGMHCEACKARIEKAVPLEKGVKDLQVDLEKKEVTVIYKPNKTTVEKLKKAIEELGYTCKQKEVPLPEASSATN
jgi:periplasmic mercuric ion binding protein